MTVNAKRSSDPVLKLVPMRPEEANSALREKPESFSATGRVQILMPAASIERLFAIKEAIEAASVTEVVRRALRLYEALLVEERDGGHVFIRRGSDDGGEIDIPLSFLFK
jgi:NADH dehydrogenase/NADH:ubiquinone oxidoreductase subunit G